MQLGIRVPRSGPPGWRVPDRHRRSNNGHRSDPLPGLRRQPDGICPDRRLRRPRGLEGSEESGPRTRRIGSVHRGGGRGPGRGRGEGWYFEPTLLSHVTKDMRVLREETFGPVAPVMAVPNLRAAIEEANDSEFGLGASLWTRNLGQADELAAQVESGMVFINGVVKSDPRMPFGGVKHSGVGRELSRYGLLEMVNIKTVEIFPGHSGQAAIQKNTE